MKLMYPNEQPKHLKEVRSVEVFIFLVENLDHYLIKTPPDPTLKFDFSPQITTPPIEKLKISSPSTNVQISQISHTTNESSVENMYPLIEAITKEEMDMAPSYLSRQLSLEVLLSFSFTFLQYINNVIAKINDYVTDARFSNGAHDYLTQPILRDRLGFGTKTKVIILFLVSLQRLATKRKDGDIVYYIQS